MLTLTTPNPTLQAQDAAEQMQVLDLEPQCCSVPILTKFIWFMGWGCFYLPAGGGRISRRKHL